MVVYTQNALTGDDLASVTVTYWIKRHDGTFVNASGITDGSGELRIGTFTIGASFVIIANKDGFIGSSKNVTLTDEVDVMRILVPVNPVCKLF